MAKNTKSYLKRVKGKGKVRLEQAMKAQMGSGGIALLCREPRR